jgi:hypothetical protein
MTIPNDSYVQGYEATKQTAMSIIVIIIYYHLFHFVYLFSINMLAIHLLMLWQACYI